MEFTKAEILALLACASKDYSRPNLYGIGLDVENGIAFTTDGHRMLCLSRAPLDKPPTTDRLVLIPRDVLESASKAAKKHDKITIDVPRDATTHGTISLESGASWPLKGTSYAPPPYRAVLSECYKDRDAEIPDGIGIHPTLLGDLAKAYNGMWAFRFGGPLDPVRAEAHNPDTGAYWTAVIMPMRVK